jgi:DNA-binding protein HU-beta
MNKKQLAGLVARKADLTRAKAEGFIDLMLTEIQSALQAGEMIRLVGFGNFVVRKRKGRMVRNPQTGAIITIGESKSPAFVPGSGLKAAIRAGKAAAADPEAPTSADRQF